MATFGWRRICGSDPLGALRRPGPNVSNGWEADVEHLAVPRRSPGSRSPQGLCFRAPGSGVYRPGPRPSPGNMLPQWVESGQSASDPKRTSPRSLSAAIPDLHDRRLLLKSGLSSSLSWNAPRGEGNVHCDGWGLRRRGNSSDAPTDLYRQNPLENLRKNTGRLRAQERRSRRRRAWHLEDYSRQRRN